MGALGVAHAAPLGDLWVSPLATFQIRPPAGLQAVPDETPEVQVLFLGTLGDLGPVSMNVIFFPGRDPSFTADEATARRVQGEVVSEMDGAQSLEVRALPADHPSGRGIEMEFLVFQQIGAERRAMVMRQRQLQAPDGFYNLTAYGLETSWPELRKIVEASLDSFRLMDETAGATGEELVLDATFRFSRGDIESAVQLASRVRKDAEFRHRVAAYRIQLAGSLAMGATEEAQELVRPYIDLWTDDPRPFSAHHSWSLRRGRAEFLRNLRLLESSKLPIEDRATLAAVALATWAGPPEAVPPRLSELQDRFYATMKAANMRHSRDNEANWEALEAVARRVAEEVSDYLVRYEASLETGRVKPGYQEEGFQWLGSSLPLALAYRVRHQDRAGFLELLERYGRLHARIPGASALHDPVAELRARSDELMKLSDQPFREIEYRISSVSGQALLDRTRALLDEGGLRALDQRLDVLRGP